MYTSQQDESTVRAKGTRMREAEKIGMAYEGQCLEVTVRIEFVSIEGFKIILFPTEIFFTFT